ncbi:MAG: rRNA pseudouridine synthase [Nanoarchaeota archaeon]|nr:rRNA pseudouridine synthase [Nanoarchaeota archaeon]MBU1644561.1 rRNA pseudouridine synthase [Nanoarchaeota archaeon]MBU1976854.1 rRNA pseudouridine synthase [Nanoarchaeota archaeon]
MQRVQKLLSNYGYCSRRKAEELIQEERVKVNGKVITIGDKASEEDQILVDNKPLRKEKKVYLIFNKPPGCVTALTDERYKTVMDYIKIKERVFPIGRLDYNTTGLLLLTNDGDFANQIMHPRHEIKKTYLVEIEKPIKNKEINQIEKGVDLEDGMTAPAKVKLLANNLLEVTIHEGRNRIIRRIFSALGFKVLFLQRVRVGKLGLGDLEEKRYRFLNDKDKEKIFQ